MDWPESGEITFCISHGSMGMAQINHAPMYYLQTRWAAVSDENGAGQVNAGVVSVISIAPLIADYPGDDFYAYLWVEDGEFVGEVWVQKEFAGIEREPTIGCLVAVIREKYGSQ